MSGIVALLLLSPLFLGFLYLPYREHREYGISVGREGWMALLAALALYLTLLWLGSAGPLNFWLDASASDARHRMLPALWATYSLPLWAVSVIVCGKTARDVSAMWRPGAAPSLSVVRTFGWVLLGLSWAVVLAFGALGE